MFELCWRICLAVPNIKKEAHKDSVTNEGWQEILTTLFWIKVMQSTIVELKLMLKNGMFLIIHHQLNNIVYFMKQIVDETPTQLQYPGRSVFMKKVNTQNSWTFELGTQEDISIHIRKITVFRQSDTEHDQNLNNDTFCRLHVTSAQCIIGTEKYPDCAIL